MGLPPGSVSPKTRTTAELFLYYFIINLILLWIIFKMSESNIEIVTGRDIINYRFGEN